jgi:hypothetical protein
MQNQWCRRGESNPRPRDYETLALPLSYAGTEKHFMLRSLRREVKRGGARQVLLQNGRNGDRECGPGAHYAAPAHGIETRDGAPKKNKALKREHLRQTGKGQLAIAAALF